MGENLLYARTKAPNLGAPAHILTIGSEPMEVQPIIEQLPTGILIRMNEYGVHLTSFGALTLGETLIEAARRADAPAYDG